MIAKVEKLEQKLVKAVTEAMRGVTCGRKRIPKILAVSN